MKDDKTELECLETQQKQKHCTRINAPEGICALGFDAVWVQVLKRNNSNKEI